MLNSRRLLLGTKWAGEVLCELKASNDVCILGLNDYLTTAVPNLRQLTRSNFVQVKKNTKMANLQEDNQSTIINLAVKQRRLVTKECRDEEM